MKLNVLGSGSKGNGYVLTASCGQALVIEAGVKPLELKKLLDFDYSRVEGVIVSHIHGDHAKYTNEYVEKGINVYTGQETIDKLGFKSHRLHALQEMKAVMIGDFKVLPIPMKHDVPCLGFVINHPESGNIVFITDSFFSPWKFANIQNWIIECNYSQEIMDGKDGYGATNTFIRNRVLSSHLSLENCQELFRVNDLSKTNNIVLTHLSDRNSNEKQFKKAIEDQTLKTTTIADTGVEINFNKIPF
jgi:phosphoribosyl 1,2-cyclic phosphodiesterase